LSVAFRSFGEPLTGLAPENLLHEDSRGLLAACLRHAAFEVIELRRLKAGQAAWDIIVVDCSDGTVPSRNATGIRNRERLALLHCPEWKTPHEVRALRSDFPATLHQNHVHADEPASLCLYFEPWTAVERDWTPQRHLERILWWLRDTARETLHRGDQPLEQLYFEPPYEIVLPPDFDQKSADPAQVLCFAPIPFPGGEPRVFRAVFTTTERAEKAQMPFSDWLVITPSPLDHAAVQRYPSTLGELHEQFAARGSGIHADLRAAITAAVPASGIEKQKANFTLIFIKASVRRSPDGPAERTDPRIFCIHADLATIGLSCGALISGHDGKAYVDRMAGLTAFAGSTPVAPNDWQSLAIEPIGLGMAVTPVWARRASGIAADAEFPAILAGVGALGSVLADLWAREGWGRWTYIDDDYIRPHNVIRHLARDEHIGRSKAELVRDITNETFYSGQLTNVAIHAKVTDRSDEALATARAQAKLLVDATTMLEVPRDLSAQAEGPRMASVFLTPSGLGSVLLLEDEARSIPLHALEAQYYRGILDNPWGADHLKGHHGGLWVGAGCRDISAVLSQENIHLHGAILARQLRLLSAGPAAQMRLWHLDQDSGALAAHNLAVSSVRGSQGGEWKVVYDQALEDKLTAMRARGLPNETGGILLGYFDQKLKMVHLVDALPAPVDSEAAPNGFTRGKQGLTEIREECLRRTAHIVDYVGDWHSHPQGVAARPSTADLSLIAQLTAAMAQDGLPALMLIVGESGIGFTLELSSAHDS
jgi:proteasome lid subunit RPN8/RPN11